MSSAEVSPLRSRSVRKFDSVAVSESESVVAVSERCIFARFLEGEDPVSSCFRFAIASRRKRGSEAVLNL